MKNRFLCLICVALSVSLASCGLVKPVGGTVTDAKTDAVTDVSAVTDAGDVTDGGNGAGRETDARTESPDAPEVRLSFLGCGDNIVYYGNVREAAASAYAGGREYNFTPTYTFVADMVKNADISFINQETLMAGDGYEFSYYPCFNGPQDMGHDLVGLGYDIIGMSNNHMLDQWGSGLEATINFWRSLPVFTVGDYLSEDEYNEVRIYEKDGVKIAFLSYTYGTNGLVLDGAHGYIQIPYLDEDTVRRQVAAAKSSEADLVFVSVHWGIEGAFEPSDEQRRYAQIMTDAGADVIIGHHPHVIEPVEWLVAEDGSKTLCVYSLGNFIGEQAYDYNMVGGMISFDIVKKGASSGIENVRFIPTVYYFNSSFYGNCVYLMKDFTEALASSHGIGNYGNYTSLGKLQGYVTSTIEREFLDEEFLKTLG